jgi:hypothetical protein
MTTSRIMRLLAVPLAMTLALTGCSGTNYGPPARSQDANEAAGTPKLVFPIDMRPLLHPKEKYFGVALPGVPQSLVPLKTFTNKVGKAPNMVKIYLAWNTPFDIKTMQDIWAQGAIPWIEWETPETSMRSIGEGTSDDYIKAFALAVKQANIPVAISYAHEFNGYWYQWGQVNTPGASPQKEPAATFDNKPQDLVKSWQHIVKTFRGLYANNVIWTWTPNIINRKSVNDVRLRPFYPGDDYVDWIGMVGYFEVSNPERTTAQLFGPTIKEVQAFTQKPFILAETGSQEGANKIADLTDMFHVVERNPNILGLLWFDFFKQKEENKDWRVDSSVDTFNGFKQAVKDPRIGFNPKALVK